MSPDGLGPRALLFRIVVHPSEDFHAAPASIVATDGTVTDGPYPEAIGGLCVVDVPSREEALKWAAKTAVACRCAQEVREFMPDPTVGN